MDKVVSYNEFLKHKDNLEAYLKELFDKIPELNLYFPISLSSKERHLIYTKSKGYLFEKLHKIGSKYSIKLWKPVEDGVNSIIEDKSEEEDYLTQEEFEDYETEEEYDFKEHLSEISSVLEKKHDIIFSELQKCISIVNRIECVFTFIMVFNFVGSVLFLTQTIDVMMPVQNFTITDF
jgi:hypothetical protein